VSIDLINHMVHEISQLSRSTSKVDLNTNSAKNEAMEYIHQMQELWYQSSRAIRKTWLLQQVNLSGWQQCEIY